MAKKTISHDPDRNRYELRLDGAVVGVADYRREGDQLVITHTATASISSSSPASVAGNSGFRRIRPGG